MKNLTIITFVLILCQQCTLPSIQEISLTGEYALPLVNATVTIESLLGTNEDVVIEKSESGTLTLKYEVELISENINELLPSVSSIGEVTITDTVSFLPLASINNFIIQKATLSGDEMRFRYTHSEPEVVTVTMRIPELTKNGEVFEQVHVMDAKPPFPFTEFTESIDLSGFEFNSDKNRLTFNYDARTPDGERIKLEFAAMSFNQLRFSYGEGNFQRTSYSVEGDSIKIDALDGWKRGTLEFEDPKVIYNITHSYGFPIALKIVDASVRTLEGENKALTGEQIGSETLLNFPSISELGETATTEIAFTKVNSNINTLVNESIDYLDYDIEAIINPDNDLDITGYVTDESFFRINAAVEMPLKLKLEDLTLQDTVAVENLIPGSYSEAELKIITENTYPLGASLTFIFLDEIGDEVERLFVDDPLVIEPIQEKTNFISLNSDQIEHLKSTRSIVISSEFNTADGPDEFVELLSGHSLDLRIGLKFKL